MCSTPFSEEFDTKGLDFRQILLYPYCADKTNILQERVMSIFGRFVFLTSVILTCVIFAQSAYASLCVPSSTIDDFFGTVFLHNKAVQEGEYPEDAALTIVMAEVKEYTQYQQLKFGHEFPEAMILTVSGIIQGEVNQSELFVLGSDGFSTTPYVTRFPIGESFIFALYQGGDGTYYLGSVCSKYFQKVSRP